MALTTARPMLHFAFTAVRSGQFVIELHAPDGTESEVGLLTVHEP